MADMTTIKGKIQKTIYPNGTGAITAEAHQQLLLDLVDDINKKKQDAIPGGAPFSEKGRYPDLSVGFADELNGHGESTPAEFTFRASGGKSIKDGTARIKRIKGNSVVWNQKAQPLVLSNYELYGHSATEDNGIHINTFVANANKAILQANSPLPLLSHKWLAYADVRSDANLTIKGMETTGFIANSTCRIYAFYTATKNNAWYWGINYKDNLPTSVDIYSFCIIDLTQMFGAGNEPTTFEEYEARKPIVEDEYTYNEGQVIHCNTESIRSVGDNAWDEQWEKGIIVEGANVASEVNIRSKNYIPIIGGEHYHYANKAENLDDYMNMFFYDENKNLIDTLLWSIGTFSTPANARYMRFYINDSYGGLYNHDIILTLAHSGWKSDPYAPYQPYWEDTLPLPIIRDYFPDGMKRAGKAYDEIRYNNALNRWEAVTRVASIDLGSLTWLDYDINGYAGFISRTLQLGAPGFNVDNGAICALYTDAGTDWYFNGKDKVIAVNNGYTIGASDLDAIVVRDTAYADAASFKEAMAGIMLYYELANPIVTEIEEVFNSDYRVADFGTEEAISSIPSAPFSADIVYGFNAVDMIRELWIKVQELESIINK